MKKIAYFLFVITFLAIPAISMAYAGENSWNPLYVEVEETQQSKNASTESRLKSQYGASAFYGCYPCTYKDTSDPYDQSTCLAQTESCLARQQVGTNIYNALHSSVPKEDHDASCQNKFGTNSYYTGNTDSDGRYTCGCKSGYKWNDTETSCILDDKDGDCKKAFGPYSFWTGKDRECGCVDNYQWDEGSKLCIKKPSCDAPNILGDGICYTPREVCVKNYGPNSYFTGEYGENNQIMCDCQKGYNWDEHYCVEAVSGNVEPQKDAPVIQQATNQNTPKQITNVDKLDKINTSTLKGGQNEKITNNFYDSTVNEPVKPRGIFGTIFAKIASWFLGLFK